MAVYIMSQEYIKISVCFRLFFNITIF